MKRAYFRSLRVGQVLVAGPACIYCLTASRRYRVSKNGDSNFFIKCDDGVHSLCLSNWDDGDFRTVQLTPFEQMVQSYIDQELK